jgi:ribonucleoside-diphosphate reductase alpha chain
MKFKRRFCKTKNHPFNGISFEERTSELKNSDGSKASLKMTVSVPKHWSQVATDIMAQKYLRRAGIPEIGSETDSRQVFHRLAGCWTDWGKRYGYFDTKEDAAAFYDETCFMLAMQMCAPNSPQWFNTGLYFAYGIKGSAQGHYYVDPKSNQLKQSTSAYERPQPHACFIQSIDDDLVNENGIMDLWVREARLFKYGSGTGTNYSTIRGSGERLSGGGASSGLMSFLKIGDRAAGAIKSGGTTRRAAKMVCLDLDHPDVEEFVNWKVIEEQKVAALVAGSKILEKHLNAILKACLKPAKDTAELYSPQKNAELQEALRAAKAAYIPLNYIQRTIDLAKQGVKSLEIKTFDTDWNSESYSTVSGQNSNNSVRVPNSFMESVKNKKKWQLKFRTDNSVAKEVDAEKLWDDIAYAAWSCADPGIQYDSTINEWHTCPKDGRINASNPCSEYMFLDDTACNLASLNLMTFYKNGCFDLEGFIHATRIWTTILDISVQMAQFPSKSIAQRSWDYRTLGLGYANIGAMLMQMGIPYGSKEALAITGSISAIMCAESYRTSAELAKDLGSFPRFEHNREEMLRVIRNHRRAAHGESNDYEGLSILPMSIDHSQCPTDLSSAAKTLWDEALALGEAHGYRNAQTTVIAPTGTIGLLMDCDTTGIEPDFALVKFKKLAGGGYFKIINQSIPPALANLGYTHENIDEMIAYCVGRGSLKDAPFVNELTLKAKGFTQALIDTIDKDAAQAFDINFLFNKWSLGEDFCRNVLKITDAELERSDLNILQRIGFSVKEIQAANEYVCGTMTLEGAPYLKDEHLAVFDCANKCGTKGIRFISYEKHIDMMAAAQPFISGAISKTINLPYEATIADVKRAYELSWKKMIKANALYRDGSKLSQPLNATAFDFDDVANESQNEKIKKIATEIVKKYVSQRRPLPSKRSGYTQKVKIGGHSVYLRSGEYEDGSLGEIFLDINKEGTLLRSIMNCFAVAVSLGLQYGVPLEEYVDTFTFAKFEPNGMVAGHDKIKRANSIIDFIFRDLAINYLDRNDLAHVVEEEKKKQKKEPSIHVKKVTAPEAKLSASGQSSTSESIAEVAYAFNEDAFDSYASKYAEARMKGYDGDPCPECSSFTLVRNGSCLKCDSCGSTTGCS